MGVGGGGFKISRALYNPRRQTLGDRGAAGAGDLLDQSFSFAKIPAADPTRISTQTIVTRFNSKPVSGFISFGVVGLNESLSLEVKGWLRGTTHAPSISTWPPLIGPLPLSGE